MKFNIDDQILFEKFINDNIQNVVIIINNNYKNLEKVLSFFTKKYSIKTITIKINNTNIIFEITKILLNYTNILFYIEANFNDISIENLLKLKSYNFQIIQNTNLFQINEKNFLYNDFFLSINSNNINNCIINKNFVYNKEDFPLIKIKCFIDSKWTKDNTYEYIHLLHKILLVYLNQENYNIITFLKKYPIDIWFEKKEKKQIVFNLDNLSFIPQENFNYKNFIGGVLNLNSETIQIVETFNSYFNICLLNLKSRIKCCTCKNNVFCEKQDSNLRFLNFGDWSIPYEEYCFLQSQKILFLNNFYTFLKGEKYESN